MAAAPLRFDGVTHEYLDGVRTHRALTDVRFELKPGELCLLLGANGSGKTTLLELVSGLLDSPARARIHVEGRAVAELRAPELARRVYHVRQDPAQGTAADLTVEEHLALLDARATNGAGALWSRLRRRLRPVRAVRAALDEASPLSDQLQQAVATLSGGERQRLALSLAHLRNTRVLLLDEVLGSLDGRWAERCLESVREAREAGCAVLMVTHDLSMAAREADHVVVLREGRVVADEHKGDALEWTPARLWSLITGEAS